MSTLIFKRFHLKYCQHLCSGKVIVTTFIIQLCKEPVHLIFAPSFMKIFVLITAFFTLAICANSCKSSAEKNVKHTVAGKQLQPDFAFRKLSPAEELYYAQAAKNFYDTHLGKTGFNGAILLAKNGQIVFEDYRGFADFKTKDSVTLNTPFHLASISKTFTGMQVLKLWEQGRLTLDDSIQQYLPGLPYPGVTIRTLLDHRSGLPNYLYFMDSIWNKKQKATNEDVLKFMIDHKPRADAPANRTFHYCNTNFVLLALVIERITHIPFPQYMKDSVFMPLGMNSTYIFSIVDTLKYIPTYAGNRPYPMDHLDCTYGDKNVYSTARDMLQWDKALYEHIFVTKNALDSAFTPRSTERKSMHNYGLAWRLYTNGPDSVVYHNGKWHGSNTSFTRLVQDTATIIVLGNKYNRAIYQAKEMSVIFTGHKDTTTLKE